MTAKMSKLITIFEKNIVKPDKTDGKEVSSNTQKQDSNPYNNGKWKQTIVVTRLDINEAYSLFENFLKKKDDNDRIIYLEKFKEHKITGHVLVATSKNEDYKQELKTVLNLPFGIKVYFDQMIAFIKQRESQLHGREENTNEEIAKPSQQTYEGSSRKRKLPSSQTYSESHVGTVARHDKNTKTEYGNVTVKKETKFDMNKIPIIPEKLTNNQVCLLFENFLEELEDEDRHICIQKLKNARTTGRTLVKACEDDRVMAKLKRTLFSSCLEYRLRFEDMIALIKMKQKELKIKTNHYDQQTAQNSTTVDNNTSKRNIQKISSSSCIIVEMNNNAQKQKINNGCKYRKLNDF